MRQPCWLFDRLWCYLWSDCWRLQVQLQECFTLELLRCYSIWNYGGLIVGFGAGFACGLVTLPFDAAKKGVTPKYRVSMAIAGMVLTSILVIFIANIYDSTLPVGLLISPAGVVLALLGALLAIPVSQKLVNDYHALITHFQQPSA